LCDSDFVSEESDPCKWFSDYDYYWHFEEETPDDEDEFDEDGEDEYYEDEDFGDDFMNFDFDVARYIAFIEDLGV
jgi:hypothetical protein